MRNPTSIADAPAQLAKPTSRNERVGTPNDNIFAPANANAEVDGGF